MNDSSVFVRTKNKRRVAPSTGRMTSQERVEIETLARTQRDKLENDGTFDDEDGVRDDDLASWLPYVVAACEVYDVPTTLGYVDFLEEGA